MTCNYNITLGNCSNINFCTDFLNCALHIKTLNQQADSIGGTVLKGAGFISQGQYLIDSVMNNVYNSCWDCATINNLYGAISNMVNIDEGNWYYPGCNAPTYYCTQGLVNALQAYGSLFVALKIFIENVRSHKTLFSTQYYNMATDPNNGFNSLLTFVDPNLINDPYLQGITDWHGLCQHLDQFFALTTRSTPAVYNLINDLYDNLSCPKTS